MKKIINIIFLSIFCLISSCSDDLGRTTLYSNGEGYDGDGFQITLAFPDMEEVSTRTMSGTTPRLTGLDLYLFVFDGNILLQTIHIDPAETVWADNGGEAANRIKFTANLPQTDNDATIHIVAIDDHSGAFAAQIDEIGYGIEDYVMPSLSLSGKLDAYWQRIELETPIIVSVDNSEDPTLESVKGTEEKVKLKLSNAPIPLIRNFAKITLKNKDTSNFTPKAWTVVNDLDAGSVVPWYSPSTGNDIKYTEYIKSDGSVKNYDELVNGGYVGVSQTGANRIHKLEDVENATTPKDSWKEWTLLDGADPNLYLYERKIAVSNPIYILIYGEYMAGSGEAKGGYYKIALARKKKIKDDGNEIDTGIADEYNVIRNIQYNVVITDVTAPGYDTPSDAAAAPAFNNVSGDVNTKNMTQISDGVDMLYANQINFVITQKNQVLDFKYRFVSDITGAKNVLNDKVAYKTTGIGISTGSVVKSFGSNADDYNDGKSTDVTERNGSEWKQLMICAKDPTDEVQIQTFTIYTTPADAGTNSDGLSGIGLNRTITLVLRNPWDYIRLETFPGQWDDDSKWPDYDPDDSPTDPNVNYFVGSEKGAPLTVFWELPAGLPEAMFPLEFQIESDRQNIENAGAGNAVVKSGPSLFEGVSDSRISYIKTVTWSDYAPDGENSTPDSRIIRARFVTTTNITSLEKDEYLSTIRIHNPYFNDKDDQFMRSQNKDVEDPTREANMDKTPIIWDFSSDEWSSFISQCAAKTFTGSVNINGLNISQSSATNNYRFTGNATEEKYFVMHRSNDEISFSLYYPKGGVVNAIVKVTLDRDQVNNTNVNLTASRTPTSVGMTASSTANITGREERIYTFTVPTDETTLSVTLKPGSNSNQNNGVRIYKIEWYPLGEPPPGDGGD